MNHGVMSMPRKFPLHVERNFINGKSYFYFRIDKGPRTRLPDDPTSEEFATAYRALLAGEFKPKTPVLERDKEGTIGALIGNYLQHEKYIERRATTKRGYRTRIAALRNEHGHRTVAGLTKERIESGILRKYTGKPGARFAILQMLRILINHAISIGWLTADPSLGIQRPKMGEVRAWREDEVEKFEARWPIGTKQRLAFALFLDTGQRRSDVVKMTWVDIAGDRMNVIQQKTGAKLAITMPKSLLKVLAVAPRKHINILTTEFGKPFTVNGFGAWLRDAIARAGLPLDCKPHGLRKLAGKRLADAGCSAHEIMAVLGHKSLAEAERYTREANQASLAASAVIKLQGRKANNIPQNASENFGETRKKKGDSK